ncbi:D-2-hydroxyacid dehydrogenase [Neobacillus drentensis]|uniref:D-2-hydroxyacid dehydrogenase n=1 Tax=Neobacillus drentensis TaxID=220684 RepID=UPI002FFFFEA6
MSEQDEKRIFQIAPDWELVRGNDEEKCLPHLRDADIVVGWSDTAEEECFKPGAKLRWLQAWGSGIEYIPLEKFAARGVILTNASGVHAIPISEAIFAMMLTFARKLNDSFRNQLQKKWQYTGSLNEIHGKTAAIIGVGAIGEETARIAKAFGMKVLGVRRSGQPSSYIDRMYDLYGLEEVLRQSDYVINTLPLTKDTYHLIGSQQFNQMRATTVYINIGRGGTTDTNALVEALKNGIIAGAGLDVFEEEPLPETSPLWDFENVIITPHNSGSTDQYHERAMSIFLHNLHDVVKGRPPSLNLVDLENQY